MKAIKINRNWRFYPKILFIILLIASMALLQAPYIAVGRDKNDGNGQDNQILEKTSLKVTKTAEASANQGVELTIHKSASSSSMTLKQGESKSITYTIDVNGSVADEITYTVSGKIKAENKGGYPANVVAVRDIVEYKVKGGDWQEAGRTDIENPQSPIPVEYPVYYDYTVTFTLPANVIPTAMRNTGYVQISNSNKPQGDYSYTRDFSVPPVSGMPETVDITDIEEWIDSPGNGVSFEVDSITWSGGSSEDPDGPWSVTLPNQIVVKKTVTAAPDATPGTYTLHNTAAIVNGSSDPADVTIIVSKPEPEGGEEEPSDQEKPSGEEKPPSGDGGTTTTTGGGGDQSTAVATASTAQATTTTAPEQVAVAPAIVSQPQSTPAPEVVAQAQPTSSAKKLPYTGLSSWYLALAILLIMAGFLLQFIDVFEHQVVRK